MENIIKKAIEGGYPYGDVETNNHGTWYTEKDNITNVKHQYELVCDPLFWQALGKPFWKHTALTFHEINLTKGWEKAVEYLSGLIK